MRETYVVGTEPPPKFANLLDIEGVIDVIPIDLDEGVRVSGTLTDCMWIAVSCRTRVKTVVHRISV